MRSSVRTITPRMNHRRRTASVRAAAYATILAASVLQSGTALAADPFLRRTAAVEVVEKVGPAVVNITTQVTDARHEGFDPGGRMPRDFFRDFPHPRGPKPSSQILGSGVIIDRDRHVLTNAHVIAGSGAIRVTLADGRAFPATLVGAAPNNDLAVLKIETDEELPWIPTGTSNDLMVGEPVIAIGNPFGLFSNSVTTGVLSAIDRSINVEGSYYYGFLQTDASINPGNSGGPLLNAEGTLVGINTAIYEGGRGIGLAIPIDSANRVIAELIEHGEIPPPWIGLEFRNIDPTLRSVMQLPTDVSGALVTNVEPHSPAELGGLKRGDLVLSIDGFRIDRDRSFFEALNTSLVGQPLELEVWRDGAVESIRVVGIDLPDHIVTDFANQFLGMSLTPAVGLGFKIRELNPDYPAPNLGIAPGDVVVGINGRTLTDESDLRRAMVDLRADRAASNARNRTLVVVRRGNQQKLFSLPSYEAFTLFRQLKVR